MKKKLADDVELLLDRAMGEKPNQSPAKVRDGRYLYNGDPQVSSPGYAARPNRKGKRRRITNTRILILLFGIAITGVLYVSHILAVDHLHADVGRLQKSYDRTQNEIRVLKAEIDQKSAWERIGRVATSELGLMLPKSQPTRLQVDSELSRRYEFR